MNYKDFSNEQEKPIEYFGVKKLLDYYGIELKLTTKNTISDLKISSVDLHRPGLALSGYLENYSSNNIQLLGHTEWNYLEAVGEDNRRQIFAKLKEYKPPIWILTSALKPHKELLEMCEITGSNLAVTELSTADFARPLQLNLETIFARKISVHANMIDIFGVGVLFIGESGIGKSECVLDLIERGHCLIGDDTIHLIRIGKLIYGKGEDIYNNYLEIRGIGFINVRSMFGVKSVRKEKRLDIILELKHWSKEEQYNRTGLDSIKNRIMDLEVPHTIIPVLPGKNIAVIAETVAMDYLLKKEGIDSSKEITDLLHKQIQQKINKKNERNQ